MNNYKIDALPNDAAPLNNKNVEKGTPTQTATPNRSPKVSQDTLIISGWENIVHALAFILITGGIIAVGFINKKLEYAIAFALILTAIALFFFFGA
jgi:hypothetical protein